MGWGYLGFGGKTFFGGKVLDLSRFRFRVRFIFSFRVLIGLVSSV